MSRRSRRTLEPRSSVLSSVIQTGTHAMGGKAGTVSFPMKFAGTPTVMLTETARRWPSVGSLPAPLLVVSRYSGSFTYRGTYTGGTFQWLAAGRIR